MFASELVAAIFVVLGLLILVGAWAVHWVLRILAVALIAVGVYVVIVGGVPGG